MVSIIYFDRLSFFSLLFLILKRYAKGQIYYFDSTTFGSKAASVLHNLQILKWLPEKVEFTLSDLKDVNGEAQFTRIYDDILRLCANISNNEFKKQKWVKKFSDCFDYNGLILFLEKMLSVEMTNSIIFLNVAKWHDSASICSRGRIIFMLRQNMWFKYMRVYSNELGIELSSYSSIGSPFLSKLLSKLLAQIALNLSLILTKEKSIFKKDLVRQNSKLIKSQKLEPSNNPMIGTWYKGTTITFEKTKRSDFFWMLNANIPHESILAYFDMENIPARDNAFSILSSVQIKSVALSKKASLCPEMPIWSPGIGYHLLLKRLIKKALISIIKDWLRFKSIPLFYIANLLFFIRQYAYWKDFFSCNNIKINIHSGFSPVTIPMNMALKDFDGVSIAYQWSNLYCPQILLGLYTEVLFAFSNSYKEVYQQSRSIIKNFLCTGYITDYTFSEVRDSSKEIRRRLIKNGARFVICFFDENSSDDRMSIITNRKTISIYRAFIELMLADSSIGLIFKPGYTHTIYERLKPIQDLIVSAKATGRCIFIDEGHYKTDILPTEAAQASDVCVGLLISGTVALESYLSGVKTVFLDLEGFYSHSLYKNGRGDIVFDSIGELFEAVLRYRNDSTIKSGFGNLDDWIKYRDPFKDGLASLRIGQYINSLLQAYNNGMSRCEAIESANQKFALMWGIENISYGSE